MLTTEWDFEKEIEVLVQEGKQESLIRTCKKLGVSYNHTLKELMEEYLLSEIEAREMMEKYWK